MKFIEKINEKKLVLISIFLFFYVIINLLEGERGLISYYDKQATIDQLLDQKKELTNKLIVVERENNLLTDVVDTDYLEILYRKKFMVGKKEEKIFIE
tara:strand:- start:749 stop:1042 length:294 start_codon:yes stop_codon:yes gene_type:complete